MGLIDNLELKKPMRGVISQYSSKKWGYIFGEDCKEYYFFWKDFSSRSDVRCIIEGASVEFEPGIDPKRGTNIARHCHLLDTSNITTYATPEKIFESRSLDTSYWEILELGSEKICAASILSAQDALEILKKVAQSYGANAILEVFSQESQEQENAYYSISAIPAVIGVKDVGGSSTLEELKVLNANLNLNEIR